MEEKGVGYGVSGVEYPNLNVLELSLIFFLLNSKF